MDQNNRIERMVGEQNSAAKRPAILVMGATGVGKSTFIAKTDGNAAPLEHDSETDECRSWEYRDKTGKVVVLIDTPGFDAIDQPNLDTLGTIVEYLRGAPQLYVVLALYLHPITENRVTATHRINLRTFQAMCGEHFCQNTIVATTMWNTAPKHSIESLERRKRQLNESDAFWGDMIRKGSIYRRFLGDTNSGMTIVATSLDKLGKNAPPLNILLELRRPDTKLKDTAAGSILTEEMKKQEERRRLELIKEREELEAEMEEKKAQEAQLTNTQQQLNLGIPGSSQISAEDLRKDASGRANMRNQKTHKGLRGASGRKLGSFPGF